MQERTSPTIDIERLDASPSAEQDNHDEQEVVLPGDKQHQQQATESVTANDTELVLPGDKPTARSSSPASLHRKYALLAGLALTAVNLALGLFNMWSIRSLSYNDIHDAPIFYYASEKDVVALAQTKKDPEAFLDKIVRDVKANHGIVLNDDAVVMAAPEFKLIPASALKQAKGGD